MSSNHKILNYQVKVNIANSIQTMNISSQIKTLISDDENQKNDSKSEEKDDNKSSES